jgi:hypothetical protein
MDLCKYKDIFGKPGEGAHSYRLFNIAIVDVLLTIIMAYIISIIFNKSFIITTIVLILLGIISHRLFCVRTTIDKLLFSD